MSALLRAELRRTFSTSLWWAMGIPVALVSLVCNLFGAAFAGIGRRAGALVSDEVMLVALSYSLVLTAVFAAAAGVVGGAGEFHHRSVTTTYLITPDRGRVLLAKMAVAGALGALYVVLAALVGVPAGMVGGGGLDDPSLLLGLVTVGMMVGALWGAIGCALGTAIGSQVGTLIGVLVYLLLVDRLLAVLLGRADSDLIAGLAGYLPGKVADIAVYALLAAVLPGSRVIDLLVDQIIAVPFPPSWWVAVLVLIGWTAAAGALGWLLGARRDIT